MNFKIALMWVLVVIYVCVISLFPRGSYLYQINEDISNNIRNAKQISEICKPYIKKYWGNKSYHLGEIHMDLNSKQRGIASLFYASGGSHGNPNVCKIKVDTMNNKILQIEHLGNDSKLDPGRINFDNWKIDSDIAINKTIKLFGEKNNFEFDSILAWTISTEKDEYWWIQLYDKKTEFSYESRIDAYTGEVYNYYKKKQNISEKS